MAKGHRSQIKRERNANKDTRPSAKLSYARVSVQKACFVLDAIRDKENFEISEEDLNAECEKQLKNVPESEKESYKEIIKDNMQFEKVIPFLLENNTFKSESKVSYKEYTEPKPEKD